MGKDEILDLLRLQAALLQGPQENRYRPCRAVIDEGCSVLFQDEIGRGAPRLEELTIDGDDRNRARIGFFVHWQIIFPFPKGFVTARSADQCRISKFLPDSKLPPPTPRPEIPGIWGRRTSISERLRFP